MNKEEEKLNRQIQNLRTSISFDIGSDTEELIDQLINLEIKRALLLSKNENKGD